MVTSDEDLEAYKGEDSKNSENVMFIEEEERVDSDETGDKVVEDREGVSHMLEGTTDIPTEFLPLEKAKSPVWEITLAA